MVRVTAMIGRHRTTLLLLAAAMTGGCGAMPAPIAVRVPRQAQVDQALQNAAAQVRRCYRAPRVSSGGRLIVTRLRVRLTPEGTLAGLPMLLNQSGVTPTNRPHAAPMAEAAIEAVMRCTPLDLPADLYAGGWREFDLTFSPLGVA
jgi:hypothetical protein